jgi:hypothetical protein
VINAIKFSIEEIEASDQYFDHTGFSADRASIGANADITSLVLSARKLCDAVSNSVGLDGTVIRGRYE